MKQGYKAPKVTPLISYQDKGCDVFRYSDTRDDARAGRKDGCMEWAMD